MKKLFSTRTSDSAFTIATLLLRLGAGALMMVNHGFDKLMAFSQKSASFADPFGIGHPTSMALTIFAEFFCAAFIILGLFTRLAAIPLIIAMAVAVFYAHSGEVFGKGEAAAVYLTCFLAILFLGPGSASLDRFIGK
ncbi:MAG TPA: DoxX family protein [Chitinophagaceae bacterium]|nr:DoxX family protein [Chitinophagaceae bacterium]